MKIGGFVFPPIILVQNGYMIFDLAGRTLRQSSVGMFPR